MVKKEIKEPEKDQLLVTKDEAKAKLQKQIYEGEEIAKLPVNNDMAVKQAHDKMSSWYDFTKEVLLRVFSTNKMEQEFMWASRIIYNNPLDNFRKIDDYLNKLKSISKRIELYDDITTKETTQMKSAFVSPSTKKVFVVHGRNSELLNSMFDFLRAIGLDPIEWSQAIILTGKPTPTIQDIVITAFKDAQAIIVLLSGDDVAKLRGEFIQPSDEAYEKELTPQARPNVLFEAGMAMTGNQGRTLLVQVGQLRKFSDIQGLHITRLDNSVEQKMELINKLRAAGCDIPDPTINGRWVSVGDFTDRYNSTASNISSPIKSTMPQLIKPRAEVEGYLDKSKLEFDQIFPNLPKDPNELRRQLGEFRIWRDKTKVYLQSAFSDERVASDFYSIPDHNIRANSALRDKNTILTSAANRHREKLLTIIGSLDLYPQSED
jgi:predicted nucleotide-binding protein